MGKKILTIDDLLNVCKVHKLTKFSSKDTGYSVAVQLPSTFQIEEDMDNSQEGLLKMNIKAFHTGKNLNKSYISVETAKHCMGSMKLRPILANIHQLSDGTWDFQSHDMEIVEEDGDLRINYIEKQVGCFTEDEPFLMQDEENKDKYFICSKIVIPDEYTRAASILKEKKEVKVSVELDIKSFSFNVQEMCLEIDDFIVTGCTLLGSYEDENGNIIRVEEGMSGSKATLEDFSVDNNSKFLKEGLEDELVKTFEELKSDECFDKKEQKGGNGDMSKLQELLKKYSKAIEDLEFEYESMTDEELETKFAELFGEDGGAGTSELTDTGEIKPESKNERVLNMLEDGSVQVTYSLSHEDIRSKLYRLIQAFEEEDGRWYDILNVYDDYFIFGDAYENIYYGCTYTTDEDVVSLGERYILYNTFLTEAEKEALDVLRDSYESVKAELESYKVNELKHQKEQILNDEVFTQYEKENEFVELKEHMDEFSLEEFKDKANIAFANCVKRLGKFSNDVSKNKPSKTSLFIKNFEEKPKSRYGSIFNK